MTLILKPASRFESGTLHWESSILTAWIIGKSKPILNVNFQLLQTLKNFAL